MLRKFGSHLREQWIGTLALFLVLSGGTAYAVTQIEANSVESRHIVNGQVKNPDLAVNAVNSAKVDDESLGGPDINEASLGKVGDADKLDGTDSSGFALAGSEGWTTVGLPSSVGAYCGYVSYGNGFNPVGYFRDRAGVVHLRGVIRAVDGNYSSCGARPIDRVINYFRLPPGYRPANRELLAITANNKPGRLDVHPDGSMGIEANYPSFVDAKVWLSLDGISFRCAPSGENGCP